MACRHLTRSPEAYRLRDNPAREEPVEVLLCGWAENEPAALVNVPRWLQREALGGHHLRHPEDCDGCPCYSPT